MILEDSFEKRFEALKNKKPIKEKKEILFRKDEGYNQKIYALYDAEHYEEAYTKLIDLAKMGDGLSASYLGDMYLEGNYVEQDYNQALFWYLKGEELGYMEDVFGSTAKGRKGAIGVLTAGRVYRDELEEYAVIMALTKIVAKDVYEK